MKARLKGSNDEFKEVISLKRNLVELSDAHVYHIHRLEFEQDRWQESCKLNPEKDLSNPIDHWQDLRERAAIAAMRSIIPTQQGKYMWCDAHLQYSDCAVESVKYADALVKKLKGDKYER